MSHLSTYNIYAVSERAAVIDLGNSISETLNNKVLAMYEWLQRHPFEGLKDVVAAYSSLTILYDPYLVHQQSPVSTTFEFVKQKLAEAWTATDNDEEVAATNISIPVCYDPVFGHDLKVVAAAKNMSPEELVQLHCSTVYRVYMLGFLPGFAYMGRVHERLVMPRRSVPREHVEAGSVGIAGWQTGIYPLESPGGWQIIGRTPVKLFNARHDPPVVLAAGDTVSFYSISLEEYNNYYVA
jgi:inhibitor of KinA